jgi:hypothetical protein
LKEGEDGENGNFRIIVIKNDGEAIRYRQRYSLEVDSFEVHDENNDGVNEPGEFISVKNIRIRNTGKTTNSLLDRTDLKTLKALCHHHPVSYSRLLFGRLPG